jgi:hypothetical protein
MPAIRFVCKTNNKKNHEEIKNRTYLSGGSIVREKIYRDTSSQFEAEMEIVSEGGTLYREAKELELVSNIYIVN